MVKRQKVVSAGVHTAAAAAAEHSSGSMRAWQEGRFGALLHRGVGATPRRRRRRLGLLLGQVLPVLGQLHSGAGGVGERCRGWQAEAHGSQHLTPRQQSQSYQPATSPTPAARLAAPPIPLTPPPTHLRLVVQLQLQAPPAQRVPQRQADKAQRLGPHRLVLQRLRRQQRERGAAAAHGSSGGTGGA